MEFLNRERQDSGLEHGLQMAIVIHDIRNLLFVIGGNIELLLVDSMPQHISERLLVVLDAIQSAGTLANNTLRKAQMVDNAKPSTYVNLSQVVEEFLALYAATIPSNIQFEVDCSKDPLVVRAEAEQIQFIVMNLVVNAIESIRGSPGSICVRAYASGDNAVVEVADDGPGLAVDDINKLFEPYESVGKGLETRGLGLSSVKESIRRLRGDIGVDTDGSNATTFTILIPLK